MSLCRYDYDEPSVDLESSDMSWREEEQASLRQSLRSLQTQFASERARREESEREAEMLAGENAALEQQLAGMEGCQVSLPPVCLFAQETQTTNNVTQQEMSRDNGIKYILILSE